MKIPKKVMIKGREYTVTQHTTIESFAKVYSNDNTFGCFDGNTHRIDLNVALHKKNCDKNWEYSLVETYYHEYGHALLWEIGIAFSGGLSSELNEIIVENYSHILAKLALRKR